MVKMPFNGMASRRSSAVYGSPIARSPERDDDLQQGDARHPEPRTAAACSTEAAGARARLRGLVAGDLHTLQAGHRKDLFLAERVLGEQGAGEGIEPAAVVGQELHRFGKALVRY